MKMIIDISFLMEKCRAENGMRELCKFAESDCFVGKYLV